MYNPIIWHISVHLRMKHVVCINVVLSARAVLQVDSSEINVYPDLHHVMCTTEIIFSNLTEKKSCTHDIRQGQYVSPILLTRWNMIHVTGDTMETTRENNEASDQEIC